MIPRRTVKIKLFLPVVIPVVKAAFVPFSATGKNLLSPVSQGFAAFRPALSRIPPRHSQSRRATNCATPGYSVFYPAGRILPNAARYQLRYTPIVIKLWSCKWSNLWSNTFLTAFFFFRTARNSHG